MNCLPNKLSKLRKHYNLSQSYLASFLGVETIEYMSYENGSEMISYEQMKKLSNLYHIELAEIFKNSEDVTLYDNSNTTTDEINIAYFTRKKSFFEKLGDFVKANKLASSIIGILLVAIIILSIFVANMYKPYTVNREDKNRLSVSDTTVIYIDDNGNVVGAGSNDNGELNNLSSNSPIKVQEGEGFSIILNEDGTINSTGLISKYEKQLSDLINIIDIAAGQAHVLALDSNGKVTCVGEGQACEVDGTRNISKVYATKQGSILIDTLGNVSYKGAFIGSSIIDDFKNFKDLASSDNILAILTAENKIRVFTKNNNNYFDAESWNDIVDVACGDYFVAGLDSHGRVHIDVENDDIKKQVNDWYEIIAIDAGCDYLIGFDGKKIYGVGNNSYKQFVKEEIVKQTLEKVSDVSYKIDNNYVYVQFKGVSNASGYSVSIDVGVGLSQHVDSEQVVKFESESMTEGKTYTISITALGNGDYKDSDVYTKTFTYEKPEAKITIDTEKYIGKTKEEFIEYLTSLGLDNVVLSEVESEAICDQNIKIIISTNIDGKTLTKIELENTQIEYTSCRVLDEE